MSKKEDSKLRIWKGKNMLKCDDCSCGNIKCEDGARFCSRCGIWRIVLALVFFILMFKIGYIAGSTMSNADAVDQMFGSEMASTWKKNSKSNKKQIDAVYDKNGCKPAEATTWSKTELKCVKLYEEAIQLNSVNTGRVNIAYLLTDDSSRYELYVEGSDTSIILKAKDDVWASEDGKLTLKKNKNNKFELSASGKVTAVQM